MAPTYPSSSTTPTSSAGLVPSLQVNVAIGKRMIDSNTDPGLNTAISLAALNPDCRLQLVVEGGRYIDSTLSNILNVIILTIILPITSYVVTLPIGGGTMGAMGAFGPIHLHQRGQCPRSKYKCTVLTFTTFEVGNSRSLQPQSTKSWL